jgi:hypothetical protein
MVRGLKGLEQLGRTISFPGVGRVSWIELTISIFDTKKYLLKSKATQSTLTITRACSFTEFVHI